MAPTPQTPITIAPEDFRALVGSFLQVVNGLESFAAVIGHDLSADTQPLRDSLLELMASAEVAELPEAASAPEPPHASRTL